MDEPYRNSKWEYSKSFLKLPPTGREPRCEPDGPETAQGECVEHAVPAHNVLLQREREQRCSDRRRDRTLYRDDRLGEAVCRAQHTLRSCR